MPDNQIIMKISVTFFCLLLFTFISGLSIFSQSGKTSVEELNVVTFLPDKKINFLFVPDVKFSTTSGKATVELNSRGTASINAEFKNLPSVLDLGGLYATYIVWAVLPDGTTQRLGELKTNPAKVTSNASLETEIQLNTFGMLVTVEPHFLVRLPSKAIVLRVSSPSGNNARFTKSTNVQCVFDESDYFRNRPKLDKKKEKEFRKTPISLIAARNAVALARYGGAETNASELYNEAVASLEQVEQLNNQKAKEKDIDLIANKTIGIAANAEKKAVEIRAERRTNLITTKKNRELEETKESLNTASAKTELLQEELTLVRNQKEQLQRSFDEKSSQSSRLEDDNKFLKEKYEKAQSDLNKIRVEYEKLQNEISKLQNIINYNNELPLLEKFLGVFGTVAKKENGLVLTLSDSIWLKQEKDIIDPVRLEKLQILFKKIGETKYLQLTIFSFINTVADLNEGQELAELRSQTLADLFISNGVDKKQIRTQAFLQNQTIQTSKKQSAANLNKIEITFKLID
jgi:hypothetical protein